MKPLNNLLRGAAAALCPRSRLAYLVWYVSPFAAGRLASAPLATILQRFPSVALITAVLLGGNVARAGDAAPFLWEVRGAAATHYLVGSVHMLPASAHPLPEALLSAYAVTTRVTFESDLLALASPDLQGRMLGAAKEDRQGGLKASIGEKLYAKLQKRAETLGMPTPVCDAFRAWFCALTLELFAMQQAGFGVEYGVDHFLYLRALEDGRAVAGLETPEEQLALFVGMPEEMSVRFLAATLDEVTQAGQTPEDLLRIWHAGDLDGLGEMVADLRRRYPEVHERLLANRNRTWLPRLAEIFGAEEPQLVVVGAAHLPGPDGLLQLLKDKGLTARPVTRPIPVPEEVAELP